jgi:hypothetical protein
MKEDPNLPDFEFEKLKKLDKPELDIIKLSLEIATFKSGKEFERKKFMWENIRVIALAVLTVILTALFTSYLKQIDTDRATREKNAFYRRKLNELKGNFIETKSVKERTIIACKIVSLTDTALKINDKDFLDTVKSYRKICSSENDTQLENKITSAKTQINKLDDADAKNVLVKSDENLQLKKQLNLASKGEKQALNKKIAENNTFIEAKSKGDLSNITKSIDSVSSNVIKQVKATDALLPEKLNTTVLPVQWFKEGYYVRYDDIKIKLITESKSAGVITVKICNTPGDWNCDSDQLPLITITYNTPYSFKNNGFTYTLSLKTIDYAGKNPFKLAAYVGMSRSATL